MRVSDVGMLNGVLGSSEEQIVIEREDEAAVDEAAALWAVATARRDALDAPAPPEEKARGLRAALAMPGASLHAAREAGALVAFVLLVPGERLEIRYLGVAAQAWGRGLAARLLRHADDVAAQAGVGMLELWVLEDNERAIAVYLREGWQHTGDRKSQVDTRRVEVRLVRPVSPVSPVRPAPGSR